MSTVERTTTRVAGLKSSEMDFQLMRSLGAANYGGGTAGEIFQRLGGIDGNDPYQWPAAFETLGAQAARQGAEAVRKGHAVSGRDHYLRASMYWRAAEYVSDPFSPEMQRRGMACHDVFLQGATLADDEITPVEVPFDGITLPGLVMRPSRHANGRTLMVL